MDVDIKEVFELAEEKHLTVKYVASQGRLDEYEKLYPTIPEWLYLVKNARTNTINK